MKKFDIMLSDHTAGVVFFSMTDKAREWKQKQLKAHPEMRVGECICIKGDDVERVKKNAENQGLKVRDGRGFTP